MKNTQNWTFMLAILYLVVQYVTMQGLGDDPENESAKTEENEEELEFKYLFFREDCYEQFWHLNFFYKDCFSITLSKGLGYGVILGACAIKFPQIIRILLYRSGQGIVPSMYYMESFMYIIVGCYNVHIESPFSVYGENMFLLLQSSIIISLLWIFERGSSTKEKIIIAVSIVSSFLILFHDAMIPELVWQLLMNCQFLMLTYARMPQILTNFRNKSTGQLSFITFSLGFCGNCARLFTVLREVTDIFYIITCSLATLYNLILSIQIILYWKNRMPVESDSKIGDYMSESEIDRADRIELEDTEI